MLRLFRIRRWSVLTACVLFTSMAATTLGALSHAATGHDDFPASVEHDASAHRIQGDAGGAALHPLECVACQSARSLRTKPDAAYQPAPAVESSLRLRPEVFSVTPAALAAQPPLRSPPAA
ncbi:MAG TPA: hypothetical protein VIX63_13235 [Vicinamibacterales bacterium]